MNVSDPEETRLSVVCDSPTFKVPPFAEFLEDYHALCRFTHGAAARSFCFRRLKLQDARFQMHKELNAGRELAETKAVPHRRARWCAIRLPAPLSCRSRAPQGLLQRAQGGHARAPQRVHELQAPAAVYQAEAARPTQRGRDVGRVS